MLTLARFFPLAVVALASSTAMADDEVWFAGGARLHGTIVSVTPAGAVRIRDEGGRVHEANAREVDRLVYDGGVVVDYAAARTPPTPPVLATPPATPPPAPAESSAVQEALIEERSIDRRPRRNRALFAGGIAMTAVGSAVLGLGTLFAVTMAETDQCGNGQPGCTYVGLAMLGGAALLGSGIAMMVIGGRRVGPPPSIASSAPATPVPELPSWVPGVGVGRRDVSLRWTF